MANTIKVTMSMNPDLHTKFRKYIKDRFGGGKVRAVSLVIQEALTEYLKKHCKEK